MSTISSPSGSSQWDAEGIDQGLIASAPTTEADEPEVARMPATGESNQPQDSAPLSSETIGPPEPHRRQPVRWIGAGIVSYVVVSIVLSVAAPFFHGIVLLPSSLIILALVVHSPALKPYVYSVLCATLPLNAILWGLLLYGTVVLVDGVKRRRRRG
jgi:hypothetical protein